MRYTLMHREIAVIELELDEASGTIRSIGNIYALPHLPVGVSVKGGVPNRGELNKWWLGRAIPASRSGIREALELLNTPLPELLLEKCLGLSLSDQYWLCPKNSGIRWTEVNFFDNPFSEDVGNALFGKRPLRASPNLMSPDNTSDGWLKKKWVIIDGKRCLIKGGSNPYQQEPINEVLASMLMERLSGAVSYIPYRLIWDGGMPYSVCEDFITSDTELVTAWHIYNTKKKPNHVSAYDHFLNCCEALGIPGVRDSLDRLLAVDYLIANTDRHMNNIGAVRNAVTLEWRGLAPVFDCGTSLWHDQSTNLIGRVEVPSKPFKATHTEQVRLISTFDWLNIDALDGIGGELAKLLAGNPFIDEQRIQILSSALDRRVLEMSGIAQAMAQ
ncbi:MAG: excisionase [Clostridiaceae bacterium]|jgi:hypothetical protein|nr:excisionase [Clostridiaceae bacterium]